MFETLLVLIYFSNLLYAGVGLKQVGEKLFLLLDVLGVEAWFSVSRIAEAHVLLRLCCFWNLILSLEGAGWS